MKRSGISSPRFNFGAQVLTSLALAVMLSLSSGRGANQVVAQGLPAAQTLEREMTGAETHSYQVDLKDNEFLQVRVEQKGIDIVLKLLDVKAKVLATMDSPNGTQGPEVLSFVAEKSGRFVLEVSSLDPKAGKGNYSIRREASRHATAQDRRRVAVERAFVEGVNASITPGQSEIALTKLEEAIAGWRELGDGYLSDLTARSLRQLRSNAVFTGLYQELNKAQKALGEGQQLSTKSRADSIAARTKLNEALEMFRALRAKLQDNALIETMNRNAEQLEDSRESLEFNSILGEGLSLSALAQTHNNLGEWKEYVDYLKLALETYQKILADKSLTDSSSGKKSLMALKNLEAGALNNLAGALDRFYGKSEEALQYLGMAADRYHALYQETRDPKFSAVEAATLMQMGQAHGRESKGRGKAIEFFNKALEIYRLLPDEKKNVGMVLTSIALQQSLVLSYESALQNWRKALEVFRDIDDMNGQSYVLYSKSLMYWVLNDKPKLKECVDQNLEILQSPGFLENWKKHTVTGGLGVFNEFYEAQMESLRLNSIAFSYRMLEDYSNSLEYYQKALAVARSGKEPRDIRLGASAVAYTFAKLEKWDEAITFYKQALEISRGQGVKEDIADDLTDVGWTLLEAANPRNALEYQNEALSLYQSVGIDGRNAFSKKYNTLLNELARTHHELGNQRLAVFYGKRGVNAIQGERQRLQNLDLISQKSFLEGKEKNYRRLADWLIEEGRLPEAQQVLMMLKEDEYFDFIRRDGNAAKELLARVDLDDTEREALRRYSEKADNLTTARLKLAELRSRANPTPEEQNQLKTVAAEIEDANRAFKYFLQQISDEFGEEKKSNVDESTALEVGDLGEGVAALYTIVGDDRYRVILTTKHGRLWRETKIKRAELDHLVLDFRLAVQNPNADPRLLAKRLYQILIAPVAKDLEAVGAKTLLWSLDGTLRYLPIAALYDGKQYLVEKYANVVITLASRTRLDREPSSSWRGLGLGVSEKTEGFNPLYAVPEELRSIIRDEALKDQIGLIPGRVMLDREFNEKTMIAALGQKYPMVHIASHFVFKPSDKESFLLLGGNGHLTLDQVRVSPTPFFEGVELLVLSACDTATGGGSNGKEVESFAVLAQKQGARAVIATLWPVADRSTREVMRRFYENRVTPGGTLREKITKAEALRKAQLALLRGEIKGQPGASRKAIATGSLPEFKVDPNAPWSHPYYWAPFVLIGNWK